MRQDSQGQEGGAPLFGLPRNPIRLRTLVRLRWLAVIGQTTAVLVVSLVLGYELPFSPCLAVIALSAWVNIFISLRWRSSQILNERAAGLLLSYDVVQLAALLYLTGGLENPFAFLFLVPVTVSATSLSWRWTVGLGLMTFACSSLLAAYHLPLPWRPGESFALPPAYIAGMWIAVLCGTAFSAFYARRLADEARQMSAALNATEMVLAREQRLSALDGLAAAAAHELGTPLGTISVVAKELKRESGLKGHHAEDLDLLISQAARCREILSRLSDREQATDVIFGQVKLSALLEDLVAPLRGPDITIAVTCEAEAPGYTEPILQRNPAISYGLANILENAVDFAANQVSVAARWSSSQVSITVQDDGPGFDQLIFDRLGDPFVTTRPRASLPPEEAARDAHEGMGLGLFIAKTLLERSGAQVVLSNQSTPQRGAAVVIRWPRPVVETAVSPPEQQGKTLDPGPATLH
jgi:two-component system sensor histidine kinase RegB